MRKQVEFQLGDKRLIAKELTLRQINQMFQSKDISTGELTLVQVREQAIKYLPWLIEGELTAEDLPSYTPSELKILWGAIKEANADFFAAAQTLGLNSILAQLRERIWSNFSKLLATS